MVKVKNPFASDAFEMLMADQIPVKPPRLAAAFDYKGGADLGQRQERAVDRIK